LNDYYLNVGNADLCSLQSTTNCMNNQNQTEHLATTIVQTLRDAGFDAYFVGGWVRDMVMQRSAFSGQLTANSNEEQNADVGNRHACSLHVNKDHATTDADIDIATSAKPDDIERLFKRTIPVGKQFGVMIVVEGGIEFEVATFRSEGEYLDGRHPDEVHFSTAQKDVERRDFTINGLLYDPLSKKIIDYVQGEADIQKKIIRTIGDPCKRFDEDKLRILRAIRFSTRFNFPIEHATYEAIKKVVPQIDQVSNERIREELVKMLTGEHPTAALAMLDDVGLLEKLMPEVTAMKGVAQNPKFHPEGDVFTHTMLMMKKLTFPSLVLSLSALFHDIGKPKTTDTETLKSPFHSEMGVRITEEVMRRLRFSNEDIEQVSWCVGNHMNFMHVQKMREGKLKRLMSRETFAVELELHRIDCLASHGLIDNYHFLIEKQKEYAAENLKPKPILTGNDLIQLGLSPGQRLRPS
jgi:putative nucleotidyltransferase with HDIG domain